MMRGFLIAVILAALVYGLGFVLWVSLLPQTPDGPPDADGVVVLTGSGPRLDVGMALLEKGVGKRLLISGASRAADRAALKAAAHGGPRFDCCVDIGYSAEDTRGNAVEAADWAHAHGYHSVVVVTARYHIPRAMHEFGSTMPDVTLLPWPVEQETVDLSQWWRSPRTAALLQREFSKYLASLVTTLVGR
jgi:uncharacterized SAM-binding protein YcdF (DUF218 family)